jgi:hypothetical protein
MKCAPKRSSKKLWKALFLRKQLAAYVVQAFPIRCRE